jgi:hypothetical protein
MLVLGKQDSIQHAKALNLGRKGTRGSVKPFANYTVTVANTEYDNNSSLL